MPPVYDRSHVYVMSPVYDHSERKFEKVGTLKKFLKSYLEIMKYESTLNTLCRMIDQCAQDKESLFTLRVVN
jgi:hypothetical protein